MQHVETKIKRIEAKIDGGLPMQATALYVAKQSLQWALSPKSYASPPSMIDCKLED